MSMPSATCADRRTAVSVRLASYVELSKPRIAALVLVTVAVAAFVGSWTPPDSLLLLHALFGTALIAASASALNQWLERTRDALMPRTADRPLPAGRIAPVEVAVFGGTLVAVGVLYLGVVVYWLTAVIGLLTWFL
jgi:protoheme IX farnesyltransferase